ncbi:MAG TPA: GNAT family protein [Lachnospiraceae bacterium]|nr:GNAT family protein [Lachnospiraceae bacterium]
MIRLETERLILRDYESGDLEEYHRLQSDDETMYYLRDIKTHSMEESKEHFSRILEDIQSTNRTMYFFHMEDRLTHEQIGSIGYTVTDRTPVGKLVHLGYFTYPKYWKRGYTSEALNEVLKFAFLIDDVYRITTGCLADNIGSEMVMLKCGMVKEAVHKNYEWHDGKMRTRLEYRLLREEWIGRGETCD